MATMKLTDAEKRAAADFKALANRWPKSLWVFAASNSLCVLKCLPDGSRATCPDGGMDSEYVVATIKISSDGGDW